MGLVIRVKKGDVIQVGEDIFIEVVISENRKIGLHFLAPKEVKIERKTIGRRSKASE